MAQSKATKKLFNMAYGLGASIVIIGALFKILHWEIDLGGFKLGGGFSSSCGSYYRSNYIRYFCF